MAEQGHQPQQLHRIEGAAGVPGVLNVVTTHRHNHPRRLQLAQGRLGPLKRGVALPFTQQPEVGGGEGHHRYPRRRKPIGEAGQLAIAQQGQAAGMAAGDGHPTGPPLQPIHQVAHAPGRVGIAFIDVEVDGAAEAIGQLQQRIEEVPIEGGQPEGSSHHAAEQAPVGRHAPGLDLALRAGPMPQRRQGHQLQFQPVGPAAPQLLQGLPSGRGGGPQAVDMAAQGPATVAPGELQGPFAPLQHLLRPPNLQLPQVGLQCTGHGAGRVGKGGGTEGLVQMDMGIDRRGDGQRRRLAPGIGESGPRS